MVFDLFRVVRFQIHEQPLYRRTKEVAKHTSGVKKCKQLRILRENLNLLSSGILQHLLNPHPVLHVSGVLALGHAHELNMVCQNGFGCEGLQRGHGE